MGLLDNINVDTLIKETKERIKRVYLQDKLPWIIGYSGGKDSTCTTQIIIDSLLDLSDSNIPLHKKVYVISSDTMVETPMIIDTIVDTISKINILAQKYNLPIEATIIQPEISKSFWVNLIGRGYPCPNQTFRWCTDRLKIEPANKFIESLINKYGEAVMILGVREGESNSRDRVLDNHTIEGKDLMRHTTQANSFVFAPIRNFTKDDVWNYLLTTKSPWGSDNTKLFKLYQDSLTGEECPIMMSEDDKKKTTCGNSRFGCWVCTVVNEDKSLSGFIKSGVKWLKPLLDYRNWLFSIRDEQSRRTHCRRNGSLYFSKLNTDMDGNIVIPSKGDRKRNVIRRNGNQWLDENNEEWQVFELGDVEQAAKNYIVQNGIDLRSGDEPRLIIKKVDDNYYRLGVGPFTMETRKEMLERLLELQQSLANGYSLIKMEELKMIQKLWYEEGDLNNSVFSIYKQYYDDYELVNDDIQLLSQDDYAYLMQVCENKEVDFSMFKELLDLEKTNIGYRRRAEVIKQIKERLSQEYLSLGHKEDTDED